MVYCLGVNPEGLGKWLKEVFSVCHRKKHFILPPQFITQVGSYILGIHIQQSPAMQWPVTSV